MQEALEEKIHWLLENYMPHLRFIGEPHRKCLVLFSGVPASGKTIIAQKIEDSLLGVRISHDDLRELLKHRWPDISEENSRKVRQAVVQKIFERLQTANNGLVIIDASVDRRYDFYENLAGQYGYHIMLLRLDMPYELVRRRMIERPEESIKPSKYYTDHLDEWWNQWKNFGQGRHFDMIITSTTPLSEIVKTVVGHLNPPPNETTPASPTLVPPSS